MSDPTEIGGVPSGRRRASDSDTVVSNLVWMMVKEGRYYAIHPEKPLRVTADHSTLLLSSLFHCFFALLLFHYHLLTATCRIVEHWSRIRITYLFDRILDLLLIQEDILISAKRYLRIQRWRILTIERR